MVSLCYFKSQFPFLKADFINLCISQGSVEEQNWLCMCVCWVKSFIWGDAMHIFIPDRDPRTIQSEDTTKV